MTSVVTKPLLQTNTEETFFYFIDRQCSGCDISILRMLHKNLEPLTGSYSLRVYLVIFLTSCLIFSCKMRSRNIMSLKSMQ